MDDHDQAMCISAEEYRLMTLIALFQSAGLSLSVSHIMYGFQTVDEPILV